MAFQGSDGPLPLRNGCRRDPLGCSHDRQMRRVRVSGCRSHGRHDGRSPHVVCDHRRYPDMDDPAPGAQVADRHRGAAHRAIALVLGEDTVELIDGGAVTVGLIHQAGIYRHFGILTARGNVETLRGLIGG